jgi:flavodoxin
MKVVRYLCALCAIIFTGYLLAPDTFQVIAADKTATVEKKKILVVYYSRSGNTKKVAENIAHILGADIEQLIDKKDRSGAGGYLVAGKDAMNGNLTELEPVKYDPSQYDTVIMGTPVWSWDMTPAIRTYILDHKNAFKDVAFFTTAGGTKPEKIVKKMEALSGKKAIASTGFVESDLKDKNKTKYEETLAKFCELLKK